MSLAMRRSKIMRHQALGDPGFFDTIVSGVKKIGSFVSKGAVKSAAGLATGGIPGAIQAGAQHWATAIPRGSEPQFVGPPLMAGQNGGASAGLTGAVTIPGVGTISVGGGGGIQIGGPGVGPGQFGPGFGGVVSGGSSTAPGACIPGMPGVRLNRTGYFLKSGQYIAPGTKCVRSRRRNPLNPRALSKAMSRVTSFKKAASVASRITIRSSGCAKCR